MQLPNSRVPQAMTEHHNTSDLFLFSPCRARSWVRVGGLCTAIAVMCAPLPAIAAPSEPSPSEQPAASPTRPDAKLERAMQAYDRGTKAYQSARYDDALGYFQEAASLYGSPDFQYNIGLCYEKLDKHDEAVRAFRTYLRAKPDAADRANVEDRIARILERTEKAGKKKDPTDLPAVGPEPPLLAGRGFITAGGVLIGVGAAVAIGGGLGFGLVAKSRSDDLDAVQNGGNPRDLTFDQAGNIETEGKRFEALQITTAAIGGAVAIGGVVLLVLGFKQRNAEKQRRAKARARVVPHFGPGHGGFVLTGRF